MKKTFLLILPLFFISFFVFAKKKYFQTFESLKNPVSFSKFAEDNKFTIVEFYVDWCETCKKMPKHYKTWLKHRPETVIKRIKLPWEFSFAKVNARHNIELCALPHFAIFSESGEVLFNDQCRNKPAYHYFFENLKKMKSKK